MFLLIAELTMEHFSSSSHPWTLLASTGCLQKLPEVKSLHEAASHAVSHRTDPWSQMVGQKIEDLKFDGSPYFIIIFPTKLVRLGVYSIFGKTIWRNNRGLESGLIWKPIDVVWYPRHQGGWFRGWHVEHGQTSEDFMMGSGFRNDFHLPASFCGICA